MMLASKKICKLPDTRVVKTVDENISVLLSFLSATNDGRRRAALRCQTRYPLISELTTEGFPDSRFYKHLSELGQISARDSIRLGREATEHNPDYARIKNEQNVAKSLS